jgi:hypothetical protein
MRLKGEQNVVTQTIQQRHCQLGPNLFEGGARPMASDAHAHHETDHLRVRPSELQLQPFLFPAVSF